MPDSPSPRESACGAASMLDVDLLRALGLTPSTIERSEPMRAGLSGALLWRLRLRQPVSRHPGAAAFSANRVLKVLTPGSSWLSALAEDTHLREIQLRAAGLLADLPRGIATGTLAHALAGTDATPMAGALLMRDERAYLLAHATQPPPSPVPATVLALLDALARLHVRFWEDARLRAPHAHHLGLLSPRGALRLLAPDELLAFAAAGDASTYLPLALAGWEAFFALSPTPAAARLRAVLARPDPYLAAITSLPVTLLHGDVWGPNLGWLPTTRTAPRTGRRLLLLDWALAAAGPATYDPLWLCGTWHTLHPPRILAAYRTRLERRLRARGIRLTPTTWQALADAGYLRTALTCGEALGRAATEAPHGAARRRAEARVRWWATRAATAAERLVPARTDRR